MRSEFEFIRNIKKKYGLNRVGDDCAVLPKDSSSDLLVTADLLVEGIDFRFDWTTAQLVGAKAAAVSLSDIAAMGGTPRWAMVTIGATDAVWGSAGVDELFDGYHRMAKKFEVEIVGGDVSKSPTGVVVDSIVGGEVPRGKAVLRSGAKPGDGIFVTGALGGSGAGLRLLEQGVRYEEGGTNSEHRLVSRHLDPFPRVRSGITLRELGVSAMIDLSDGLSSDLGHICDASGVGATVDGDDIPVDKDILSLKLDRHRELDLALNSGEDYELLFTADEKKISAESLARFHRIGTVTEHTGIIGLSIGSERRVLERSGYQHFRDFAVD